jgi:pimeloyl-ACP methyl ester carboxylesterase
MFQMLRPGRPKANSGYIGLKRQYEMRTELISIETNTLPLDGAFYLPETGPCGAVMLFHGDTMNFYVGSPRFLPQVLTQLGFACLAFNRRGHDILSIRDSRAAEGAAFQLTKEGIAEAPSSWPRANLVGAGLLG